MSEAPQTPENAQNVNPAAGGSPITVHAQYIKDLSFENPGVPRSLSPDQEAPAVDVALNVEVRGIADNTYEVTLQVKAKADGQDGKPFFLVDLSYALLIGLKVPEEQVKPIMMIEGPRLAFPFVRQIIATTTRDGGYPPLMINPVDFVAMYKQSEAQAAQAAQSKEGTA